jgi:F-type H+-transporting ATPase subunit delta
MSTTGASTAAESYAKAFLSVARAEGALATVQHELATFSSTFTSSSELQNTLTDPALPLEKRMKVIETLLGASASPVTVQLISLAVGSGRAKDLPAITAALAEEAAGDVGREAGEVRSAHPLTEQQQAALTAAAEKATGKKLALTFLVDSAVIGGVVTRIGDTVIDGSVRRRLEQLKTAV